MFKKYIRNIAIATKSVNQKNLDIESNISSWTCFPFNISQQQPLLDTQEAADYLNVKKSTLENYRSKNIGPRYCTIGKLRKYRLKDLDEYIEDNIINSSQTNN